MSLVTWQEATLVTNGPHTAGVTGDVGARVRRMAERLLNRTPDDAVQRGIELGQRRNDRAEHRERERSEVELNERTES